jgi:hypothetical protein
VILRFAIRTQHTYRHPLLPPFNDPPRWRFQSIRVTWASTTQIRPSIAPTVPGLPLSFPISGPHQLLRRRRGVTFSVAESGGYTPCSPSNGDSGGSATYEYECDSAGLAARCRGPPMPAGPRGSCRMKWAIQQMNRFRFQC